jgi:hypothetical protein
MDIGYEIKNGERIGRDPRQMEVADLNALGHQKMPLSKAIREKCIDCCCGQEAEVRKCTAFKCALWPYRMRRNPFSEREGNPAGIAALIAARAAKAEGAPDPVDVPQGAEEA